MPKRLFVLDGSPAANSFARDLAHKLFRRKRFVLASLGVWTVTACLYFLLQAPKYEHEIRFLVRNNRVGVPLTPESNNGPIYRDYVDETAIATQIQLLLSHELLREVVKKSHLAAGSSEVAIERAVKELRGELKAGPVQKANMIKVRYASTDRQEVERVLRTVADLYLGEHLRALSSTGAHELFDKQAIAAESKLKEIQSRLTEFQAQRGIVLLGPQKELSVRRMIETEIALRAAETARAENQKRIVELKERVRGLDSRITTQQRDVPNQYSMERLNTMLVELQNRRTQLLTKFQPGDRLVREVNQQIADTQAALGRANTAVATEQVSDVNPLRQTVESEIVKAEVADTEYKARLDGLRRQIGEARAAAHGFRTSTPEDENLERQLKEAEANFFLYSKKREEARIEEAMDRERISNVFLLDPPRAPPAPIPRMSVTSIAAFLLGCLLIAAMAVFRSMADPMIYTAWELEGATGFPVVAAVPLDRAGPPAALLAQPIISEINS